MQKITSHLWFDKEAVEAADFYTSTFQGFETAFGESKVKTKNQLSGTPSGTVDIVTIDLFGQEFTLLSAGPYFKFTPAISYLVACRTPEEVDAYWNKLSSGGKALMELGSYPFSQKYGWIQDKYGLSWQIMLMGDRPVTQKIIPTAMFVGKVCGKAEEAMNFYVSVFQGPFSEGKESKVGHVMRYNKGEEPDQEGAIRHAGFTLLGQEFAVMDSAWKHEFNFNEAISFIVHCESQEEMDYYWEKLSAVPESEQCGWLKDKYGISWQIVPNEMDKMMATADKEALGRVTQAFLKMKKFDLAELRRAYEGK